MTSTQRSTHAPRGLSMPPQGVASAAGRRVRRTSTQRVLCHVRPPRELGPAQNTATLVVVAGIHGNEPAGLHAAARVFNELARLEREVGLALRGELVVMRGNTQALDRGVRFLERDLNRGWHEESVERLRRADQAALDAEDHEQRSLIDALDVVVDDAAVRGAPVVLADLHTSSAPGVPFVLYGARPAQRDFVKTFPIPVVSGIVEKVDGVLSEFVSRTRGAVTFTIEGGQHEAPSSVDALEAALWLCLQKAGIVDEDVAAAPVARAQALLETLRGDLPRMVDVVSRHAITSADEFVMEGGFRNVDRIGKGQLLGRDCRGEVRASEDGVVVLPLYQKLGDDGFFWGREVHAD